MKAERIFKTLCNIAPLDLAMSYDNAGFLIGNRKSEINKAVVCLDVTSEALNFALSVGANLVISHHPVIFEPLKTVTVQDNKRVYTCLANGISVISMHTNLDCAIDGVNDCLASALSLRGVSVITDEEGFSFRMGNLSQPVSAEGFARYIKSLLGGVVRYTDNKKNILKVAVCGGSGGDLFPLALSHGADALVTADVKHNYFIDAAEAGFNLFDAGHFNTENVIVEPLAQRLNEEFPSVEFISYNLKEIKTV